MAKTKAKKRDPAKKKTAKKRKHAGQPTKYRRAHCQALIDFFDVEPWESQKIEHFDEDGAITKTEDGKRVYRRMPTIEGFAKTITVCIATVYNWLDKEHASFQPKFLESYNRAREYRKNWLVDVGLSGLAPANSFKFVAVNCTDMRDKNETEHSGSKSFIEALSGAVSGNDSK